jgi:hypothetical protein
MNPAHSSGKTHIARLIALLIKLTVFGAIPKASPTRRNA